MPPPMTIALFAIASAPAEGVLALAHQGGDDIGDRFFLRHHADRLPGHQAAALDIAVDHRAAERAGPEVLDPELRLAHVDTALVEQQADLALLGGKFLGALVLVRTL